MKLAVIVEGHGDVQAAPVLLRRIVAELIGAPEVSILRPLRVPKSKLVKAGELERSVELAARQVGEDGGILTLLDADEDCAGTLGPALLARAMQKRPDRRLAVVLAVVEFEAWFVAAARSLRDVGVLEFEQLPPVDPENVKDPKKWLEGASGSGWKYRETLDQAALVARMDLSQAQAAPSFEKLVRDLRRMVGRL
jgi:hypothetical protein